MAITNRDTHVEQVGIRELKARTSEIIRRVREDDETIAITYHGQVVARIVPVQSPVDRTAVEEVWAERKRLAAEISRKWIGPLDAVEAVKDQRREL